MMSKSLSGSQILSSTQRTIINLFLLFSLFFLFFSLYFFLQFFIRIFLILHSKFISVERSHGLLQLNLHDIDLFAHYLLIEFSLLVLRRLPFYFPLNLCGYILKSHEQLHAMVGGNLPNLSGSNSCCIEQFLEGFKDRLFWVDF